MFDIRSSTQKAVFNTALDRLKKSEYLIDFFGNTGSSWAGSSELSNWVSVEEILSPSKPGRKIKKEVKKEEQKEELTPKTVYELKMLNDKEFEIKVDPTYVDEQIETFKDKLGMIKSSEFDMDRGTNEIGSMLARMENRKKYPQFKDFYEEFPYTSTGRIQDLVKAHDYLRVGKVEQFLADMPKDAVQVMKDYTKKTQELCDKKPVFYIIANKKDFEKTEKRRDPILLAQSPFGHFWQILGAWDEEMLFLGEL